MYPMGYESGYDNYGDKMMSAPLAPIQPTHEMLLPMHYGWKESPLHSDEDYSRWLLGPNKNNYAYRQRKQDGFVLPDYTPSYGYSPNGHGNPNVENEQTIEQEHIPFTFIFKGTSRPFTLQHGELPVGHEFEENGLSHLAHRGPKPMIEFQETITPYRKANKEEVRLLPYPVSKYSHSKSIDSRGLNRCYSFMKDKNSHNFGLFNKMYDLGLQMNKANGYVLNPSHQVTSQGHVDANEGDGEPESESTHDESSQSQEA